MAERGSRPPGIDIISSFKMLLLASFVSHDRCSVDHRQEVQDKLFLDNEHGGYFSSSENDKSILIRIKDDYDGAEPSASSISALNLLRFSSIFQSSIEFTKKVLLWN